MSIFLSLKEVRAILATKEFQKNLKRGFLCAIGFMAFLLIKNKAVYAADQPVVLIERYPNWRESWRERLFSGRYTISNSGLAAGIVTAGLSGVVIYNLYNNNNLLKTTLNGMTANVNGLTTTISELMKKTSGLELTVYKKMNAINYLSQAVLIAEKTVKNCEHKLAIAERARVFIL
jgi:hypothetical protein